MQWPVVAIGIVAGCGRFDFQPLAGDGAAGGDGAGRTPVLVENFEAGTLVARWTKTEELGTVVVDGTRPHRGSYALHAQSAATTSAVEIQAMIGEGETFPELQGGGFARMFVYIATPGTVGGMQVLFEMQRQATSEGQQLGPLPDQTMHLYQYGTTPEQSLSSVTLTALDQWVCVEWQMLGGDSRVWVNDVELPDLHVQGLTPLVYDNFIVGEFQFSSDPSEPAHELWFDDVVLDTQRIGCAY